MREILSPLISTAISVYVILQLYGVLLQKRVKSKGKKSIIFILAYMVILGSAILKNGIWIELMSVVLSSYLLGFWYDDKVQNRTMAFVWISFVMVYIQISVRFCIWQSVGYLHIETGASVHSVYLLSTAIIEYIVACLVDKLCKVHIDGKVPWIVWIIVLGLPVISFYVIISIYGSSLRWEQFILITLSLFGINVGVIYLYDFLNEIYEEYLQSKVLAEQNLLYRNQLQVISDAYDTVRSVKHDIKNNLNTIKNLLENDKTDDVIRYIDKINGSSGFNMNAIDTGNHELDGILNYKIQEAKNQGIKIEYRISVPAQMQTDPFDLSIIIGNLLDNAVREVAKAHQNVVYFTMEYSRGVYIIVVKNAYVKNKMHNKNTSNMHGIGLKNVQKAVDKYGGEMIVSEQSDNFTVKVLCYDVMEDTDE